MDARVIVTDSPPLCNQADLSRPANTIAGQFAVALPATLCLCLSLYLSVWCHALACRQVSCSAIQLSRYNDRLQNYRLLLCCCSWREPVARQPCILILLGAAQVVTIIRRLHRLLSQISISTAWWRRQIMIDWLTDSLNLAYVTYYSAFISIHNSRYSCCCCCCCCCCSCGVITENGTD